MCTAVYKFKASGVETCVRYRPENKKRVQKYNGRSGRVGGEQEKTFMQSCNTFVGGCNPVEVEDRVKRGVRVEG